MVGPLLDALAWSMGETADRPDCLIVDGDLTLNGESESHLALAERFKAIEAAGVSVYVLPGNHDLYNPGARSFFGDAAEETRTVSPAEFKSIYGPYGFDEALSLDRESLSYLVQPRPDVRLLMLDSTCSEENLDNGYSDAYGFLSESTRAWIAECADRAAADGARLVAAMHHSLIDHNELIHAGYTIDDSPELVSLFSELGLSFVLTGHTHIQDIAQAETPRGPVYDITTNALSVYPHNYGLLRLSLESGSCRVDYEGRRVDVETWARATGAEDPRLSDFARYSEQFIADHSRRMMASILNAELEEERTASGPPIPSAEQVDELIDLLVKLNTRFFAGKENADPEDASEPETLGLLASLPEGFLADYARSISRDQAPADEELHLR